MRLIDTAVLLMGISLLFACSDKQELPLAAPESIRHIEGGVIVGFADRFDTWSWLGIPFAAPPAGELRWRAPQPVSPWRGTLETLEFSDMCPQLPVPVVDKTGEPWLGVEDCLYLNVSAPRSWTAGNEPLPVMVWIHGGGNSVGSADLYKAVRNLAAREQVVVVNIHYRLGILGWFSHPALRELAASEADASGNFGTLDTIAALRWVQQNIGVFGGDPGNVTIFGESAGGINTLALMLSPLAENLFHRAVSQSGMLITTPVARAENAVDASPPGSENSSTELLLRLLQSDGLASSRNEAMHKLAAWDSGETMAYLRGIPAPQLLQQMQGVQMGLYPAPMLLRDGVVLPAGEPLERLREGSFNRVPVILGTNRDEMRSLMLRNPDYTKLRLGVFPVVIDQPLYDRVTGYGAIIWKAVGADEPASAMWSAGHRDIFVYRFDWDDVPSRWFVDFKELLGAAHGFEIPFVFHDTDNEMTYMPFDLIDEQNHPGALPLAAAMSSYWGQFARGGDPATGSRGDLPPWPRWREQGDYVVFDTADEGGIRTQQGAVDRDDVLGELARDQAGLGGQGGVCTAYKNLFGEGAIFAFTAACAEGADCSGAPQHFCL